MLTPSRFTMARPTTGEPSKRLDDEWTGEHKELPFTRTGSTNFEEKEQYKAELDNSEDEHRPQQAPTAKGASAPTQPTPQERAEHELTHQPYIGAQSAYRAKEKDHHKAQQSRRPVIQCDFAYIKGLQDKTVVPIFTAHGSLRARQDTATAIPAKVPTELPMGLWPKHSNLEQHGLTVRSGGSIDHHPEGYSSRIWRQHAGETKASQPTAHNRKEA